MRVRNAHSEPVHISLLSHSGFAESLSAARESLPWLLPQRQSVQSMVILRPKELKGSAGSAACSCGMNKALVQEGEAFVF